MANLEKLAWGRRVIIGGRAVSKDMRGLMEGGDEGEVLDILNEYI